MKNISFKKFIIILSSALAAMMVACIIYVADSLKKYENNQLDNYITHFIDDLQHPDASLTIVGANDVKRSAFDKADATLLNGIAYLSASDTLTYNILAESKNSDAPVFDIFNGVQPILRVTLGVKAIASRLGLPEFRIWEVKEVRVLKKDGLYDFEISVPNDHSVEVNGKKLTYKETTDSVHFADLEQLSPKAHLTYKVDYIVRGLTDVPDVKITDSKGQPVEVVTKGTKLTIPVPCEMIADEATAKTKIKNYPDVQFIARQWSLLLSNDLHGGNRGFDIIKEYLIDGSYLCHFAYKWCTSVDITYVGAHGLQQEAFTNEKVCNFEIFSDREFECDVFLDKNIRVHNGLVDKMGERMHFAYCDTTDDGLDNPQWKLVYKTSIPVK